MSGTPEKTSHLVARIAKETAERAKNERSGGALSFTLRERIDGALLSLWEGDSTGLGIFALGGYGRGEMAPYSDVDLLFLLGSGSDEGTLERCRQYVYRLWDGGFDVGYSIRSRRETLDAALTDTNTRTALLENRFLAGDDAVRRMFRQEIYPRLLKSRLKKFVQYKLREREERHRAYGKTPFLLEPNVKEGEGGLRDLHNAFWLTRVGLGTDGFRGIDRLLPRRDVIKLYAAWDFLQKVRIHLHLYSGRRNEVLDYESQSAVAAALGYGEKYGLQPSERAMRRYYLHAREISSLSRELVEQAVRAVFGRIGGPSRFRRARLEADFRIERGYLIHEGRETFGKDPVRILDAFRLSARHQAPLSRTLRRRLGEQLRLVSGPLRNDPRAAASFLALLAGPHVYDALKAMHGSGVLGRYLPEFGRLRALVVRDPYHRYTVDEHSLHAVQALESLGQPARSAPGWLREVFARTPRRDLLFFSLLVHDIGKGAKHSGEHSRVDLTELFDRLCLSGEDAKTVAFLVRNHLLLSEYARRREIDDPDVVKEFARRVGTIDRLETLLLVTYADISAVRPDFWSEWKAYLIRELYNRTRRLLGAPTTPDEGAPGPLEKLADSLQIHAKGYSDRYRRATPEAVMEEDMVLVREAESRGFAFRVARRDDTPLVSLAVCAPDLPGLLSGVTAILASGSLNIVRAEAFTGSDGKVIDRFVVSNWEKVFWEGLEDRLRADLEALIVRGESPSRPSGRVPRAARGLAREIRLDNEGVSDRTRIEIECPDRIGLLSDLFSEIHKAGLDVELAGVETDGELASDTIFVRRAAPEKLFRALAGLAEKI